MLNAVEEVLAVRRLKKDVKIFRVNLAKHFLLANFVDCVSLVAEIDLAWHVYWTYMQIIIGLIFFRNIDDDSFGLGD